MTTSNQNAEIESTPKTHHISNNRQCPA